ncbi:MAG: pyridoxamine 5'-phosphate oxidase family protein [Spirochaetia bacterium]|nr:pyridoxamine 5'-phosphate oxidase family protein [Spirochaetia bacterium]
MEKNKTHNSRSKKSEVKDLAEIYKILDEGLICHISFIRDGYPVVLPSNYSRYNDQIILHGGNASPFHQALAAADDICLSVALLDGLVLGKSAYNHSVNYRSVVIFGKARMLLDKNEKLEGLKSLINHVVKNRYDSVRQPTDKELDETMVLSIPIYEYSSKMRTGKPNVKPLDENFPVWSGVLPLALKSQSPVPDEFSKDKLPDVEIQNYNRNNY